MGRIFVWIVIRRMGKRKVGDMAIIVGDRAYKKFDDEILVNGTKLMRAYADGTLVYPESGINVIKVVGNTMIRNTHKHKLPQQAVSQGFYSSYATVYDLVSVGSTSYSFDGSFSWVIYATNYEAVKGDPLASEYIVNVPGHRSIYSESPLIVDSVARFTVEGKPLDGMQIKRNPFKIRFRRIKESTSSLWYHSELMIRYNMSPVQLCQPIYCTATYRGEDDGTMTVRTTSPTFSPGPEQYNGMVFHCNGMTYFSYPEGSSGGQISAYASTEYGVTVSAVGYQCPPIVYQRVSKNSSSTYTGNNGWNLSTALAYIPITDIVYSGPIEDAPEDVLHPNVKDLVF